MNQGHNVDGGAGVQQEATLQLMAESETKAFSFLTLNCLTGSGKAGNSNQIQSLLLDGE